MVDNTKPWKVTEEKSMQPITTVLKLTWILNSAAKQ